MSVNDWSDEYGVCVCLNGDIGEIFVVSVYCRCRYDIEPYLAYMHRMRECVKSDI